MNEARLHRMEKKQVGYTFLPARLNHDGVLVNKPKQFHIEFNYKREQLFLVRRKVNY